MDKDPDSRHRADENSAGTNLTVNYEPTDVDPATILKYLVALLLTVFASMLIVWGVYRSLAARAPESATPGSPLRESLGRILPPEPRLQGAPGHQVSPPQEFRQVRAEAEAALDSYGWVDEKAGLARIPIGEAMKLVVERGLESRGARPGTKVSPQQAPTPRARTIREKRP